MDDFDKTVMGQEDVESDVTMPGKRDRKPDGRFAPGDLIMGRYKVLSELGQGGMGVVYKCFDETAGIEVALKTLPPELSHNTIEMEDIKENFQLVHNLHHPNIASSNTLERDNSNGNYYLIMECVDGEDLRRWIKRKRRDHSLNLETVLPVIQQVATALDYAHSEGVIHRDIKPANIMVTAAGQVKLLDFGLAVQIRTSMTHLSMLQQDTSGTTPYMAPEQWRGRGQRPATDQYALAVLVYEMLAGHLPFDNQDKDVLRACVLTEQPEAIDGVSDAISTAVQKAMAKDPQGRFATCVDFADALSGNVAQNRRNVVTTFRPDLQSEVSLTSPGNFGNQIFPQNIANQLKRIRIYLQDEEWKSAAALCESVLAQDAENAEAYLYKAMNSLHCRRESDLANVEEPLGNNRNYLHAVEFAIGERKKVICDYAEQQKARKLQTQMVQKLRQEAERRQKEKEALELQEQQYQSFISHFDKIIRKGTKAQLQSKQNAGLKIIHYKDVGDRLKQLEEARKEIDYQNFLMMTWQESYFLAKNIQAMKNAVSKLAGYKDTEQRFADTIARAKKHYLSWSQTAIQHHEALSLLQNFYQIIPFWSDFTALADFRASKETIEENILLMICSNIKAFRKQELEGVQQILGLLSTEGKRDVSALSEKIKKRIEYVDNPITYWATSDIMIFGLIITGIVAGLFTAIQYCMSIGDLSPVLLIGPILGGVLGWSVCFMLVSFLEIISLLFGKFIQKIVKHEPYTWEKEEQKQ